MSGDDIPQLDDFVLTPDCDTSAIAQCFAEVAAAAEMAVRALGGAIDAAALASPSSLSQVNLTFPGVRPMHGLELPPKVLDALLPGDRSVIDLRKEVPPSVKIQYRLHSGNVLTIIVAPNGEIVEQRFVTKPTKSDELAATHCLSDALTTARKHGAKSKRAGKPPGRPKNARNIDGSKVVRARALVQQKIFAGLCGISVSTLQRIERDTPVTKLVVKKVAKYCKILGMDVRESSFRKPQKTSS